MRHGKTLFALCALLLWSNGHTETDNTGFALAFGAGPSSIKDTDGPNDTFDGSDIGYYLDMEWRLVPYFGFGINVFDLGEDTQDFNGEQTTIAVDGFGFFVRGYLPVSDRAALFAHLGKVEYNVDIEPGGGSRFFPFSESADDFGVGLDVNFPNNWSLRLQHRWLDGERQEEGSLTTIGARYQF